MTLRNIVTLNMSTSIDNSINLLSHSADFVKLPSLFSWKRNFNASFLKRAQTALAAYEAYVKTVHNNLQSIMNHMNTEGLKYIELLQKRNQYVFLQKSENEELFKKYDKFQVTINQLKDQLVIAQVNAQTFEPSQFFNFQRFVKAPEAFEFTGDDKVLTRFFIFMTRNKVTANWNHFQLVTEMEIQLFMIVYIFFKFRGTVVKRALALVFNDQFVITDNFFQWIERVFGDLDSVATAQTKIKKCKQKNRFFQKYLVEFFMYINDTGYNETAQKIVFYDELFIEIKQYLVIVFWRNMNFVVF